ncbi:MAG: hypothetical protein R3E04_02255 [Sphingobium sp.]
MIAPLEGVAAFGAALMMAVSPITGPCEGRTVQLCSASGETRHILLWDEDDAPLPQSGDGKACHACMTDRKKAGKKTPRRA